MTICRTTPTVSSQDRRGVAPPGARLPAGGGGRQDDDFDTSPSIGLLADSRLRRRQSGEHLASGRSGLSRDVYRQTMTACPIPTSPFPRGRGASGLGAALESGLYAAAQSDDIYVQSPTAGPHLSSSAAIVRTCRSSASPRKRPCRPRSTRCRSRAANEVDDSDLGLAWAKISKSSSAPNDRPAIAENGRNRSEPAA
jgi:hypothetical protein